MPAAHAVQARVPEESELYAPGTQAEQTADVLAAMVFPYLPTGQAKHAEAPVVSALYLPAAHEVHNAEVVAVAMLL